MTSFRIPGPAVAFGHDVWDPGAMKRWTLLAAAAILLALVALAFKTHADSPPTQPLQSTAAPLVAGA